MCNRKEKYLDELIKVRFEQVDFAVAVMFALGHGLLDEVAGADVDEDVLGVVEGGGDVEGGGEGDEDVVALGAEGEIVEGGGGDLQAGGGGANVGEAFLEKINFQIALLFHRLQLLHAHPLQTLPRTS